MTGIFDSGIGGLFILQTLLKQVPYSSFLYLADTKYFPYGDKSVFQLRSLVRKNIEYLASRDAENIIIACNTASAVLEKSSYPMPVCGVIESALQQAKVLSQNNRVVLLATQFTVQSNIYIKKIKN